MPRIRAPRLVRTTSAYKLLLAGLILSGLLTGSISVFLVVSRDQQTRQAAQSSATSRAVALRQRIQKVTLPQTRLAAEQAATLPSMPAAVSGPSPTTAVRSLFTGSTAAVPLLADEYVVVFDARGTVVYTSEMPGVPHLSASSATVASALHGLALEGVENLGPGNPAYDIAVPVFSSTNGNAVAGVVAYSAPLTNQLARFAPATTYPTAYIPADGSGKIFRVAATSSGAPTVSVNDLPSALSGQTASAAGGDRASAFYTVPGSGEVAGDFVSLSSPDQKPAGYIGVELPLADFAPADGKDKLSVILVGLTVVAVAALAVVVFVNRF